MPGEILTSFLKQTPFAPFRVRVTDGRTLHIYDPGHVLVSPGKAQAFIFTTPDEFQIVQTKQITEIAPLHGAA